MGQLLSSILSRLSEMEEIDGQEMPKQEEEGMIITRKILLV
jgi:hypothetical protein